MQRNKISTELSYSFLPQWLSERTIAVFLCVFAAITILWLNYAVPLDFAIVSILSVVLFFYGCNKLTKRWQTVSEKRFVALVLQWGIGLRLLWCIYTYFFNISYFGLAVGALDDTGYYLFLAQLIEDCVRDMDFSPIVGALNTYLSVDDMGYPICLALEFLLTFDTSDVVVPFVVKSVMGAYTTLFIYRIALRHFSPVVARMAAIFCILCPNMIWWCGSMMKETEMVFFSTWTIERMDAVLVQRKLSAAGLLPVVLLGAYVFLYRAALGAVIFLTLLATIVLSSTRIVSWGKKVMAGLLVFAVLGVGIGNMMLSRTEDMAKQVQEGQQKSNMEWRAEREGGNSFAKYAGAAVFAPLIFTIPFPTLACANAGQFSQMQMAGGNFIKNILSFLVIYSMFALLLSGEWRKHVLPVSFMLGYLAVLVLSGFAQSGRFHMPIWPFEMMFAAYGLSIVPRNKAKRWYTYVLIFEVIACFGWQWFKLKGRGMI